MLAVSGQPASEGAWTTFLCPTHDDNQASAGIKYDADQHRTVLRCFAGCPDGLILDSLGLTVGDLFDRQAIGSPRHVPTLRQGASQRTRAATPLPRKKRGLGKQIGWPEEVAQYVYRDIHGQRVGRVIRTRTEHEHGVSKGFYLRRYDPATDTWPLGAFEPILYRLPQIAAAIHEGQTIWICEGEKDANRAAGLGLAATCNALGAGSFTPTHAQQLAGARRVVIVADRDRAGYAHARAVRKLVLPLVRELVIVEARDGKDFSDHIDAGHGLEDFDPVSQLGYTDSDVADLVDLRLDASDDEARMDSDPEAARLIASVGSPAPQQYSGSSADHVGPHALTGYLSDSISRRDDGIAP
ncbi:hypothetical protein AWN90_19070 [Nocardia terpenica]|uniref:Toprim domain-containing protein n=1 Tax=Nocardia terpenica TaxID=455432 RepID=A0A164PF41_9NOCA|nr:hypothetical protein AWN90_19070 [Nocardia terpenica]